MRKRLTERFPFLAPVRRWQRIQCFYLAMRFDDADYADRRSTSRLAAPVASLSSPLINRNTGCDIAFQYGKVHNLHVAARSLNGLLIYPGQTFSFWQCVRRADRQVPYKDGLVIVNGKLTAAKGDGLCQLGTLLYRLLLQTPLTLVERHAHEGEPVPPSDEDDAPPDSDAAICEGWLDLKFRNDTVRTFQLDIFFDETHMHGRVLADGPLPDGDQCHCGGERP